MEARTKQAMRALYDLLPEAQIDDAESRYDNLEVILHKVIEEYNPAAEHVPGLDEHIHELTHEVIRILQTAAMTYGDADKVLRNCLLQLFWFGYEAGKVNWPLPRKHCEEAHT